MPVAQDLTKANNRAVPVQGSITLKFTVRDLDKNPIDIGAASAIDMHIEEELGDDPVVSKSLASGITPDPDQVNNTGVFRVALTGGAGGDTDRTPAIHFYDVRLVLAGKTHYVVKPASKIEFELTVTND